MLGLALLAGLAACDDAAESTADAGFALTGCGQGAPSVTLGVDRPFQPNPDLRFALERGLQGGVHLDVSLRLEGSLDADDATVSLHLRDGDWLVSEHITAHWLLNVMDDWCEYPRARLVLLDREGGLFNPADTATVIGRPLQLVVEVETPLGTARADAAIELYDPGE